MTAQYVEARPGAYADSVTLLQASAAASAVAGVRAALVAMATELNIDLAAGLGFTAPPAAGPNDMLVAVRADDDNAVAAALAVIGTALDPKSRGVTDRHAELLPRTTGSAARHDGPGIALISVPGRHAFAEAMDALEAGCDVMIFSDNVPVEQEIAVKDAAARLGLLVMGPDCGTAIVGGIGLGFSHSVPAGPVGIVAASGSGAQRMICLLDAAGAGISAVLGVGGRDLSAAVGGRSARAALAVLDEDPATELIVIVSKPPDAAVAADLRAVAGGLATPVQFALTGPGQPDLTAATETALRTIGRPVPDWRRWPAALDPPDPASPATAAGPDSETVAAGSSGTGPGRRTGRALLRGLFSGGTLCDEAMAIAAERLGPIWSNIPLRPEWRLDHGADASRHLMLDFGDDELTSGRPHPMIDLGPRLERLAAAAAGPDAAVIMLDVVLGFGAHPDPAGEIGPAIAAALAARRADGGGPALAFVISLIGASSDPQGLDRQADRLRRAGADVFAANGQAARFACDLIEEAR